MACDKNYQGTFFPAKPAVILAKKGYMSEGDVVKTMVNRGPGGWYSDAGI